jgi:hypothetical protein
MKGLAAALSLMFGLAACGGPSADTPSTQGNAPSASSVCDAANTPTPDIGLRATVVQQAQLSDDPELRRLASELHDADHGGSATALVPTDEGAPPVAKRYDAVYAWCQER